MTEQPRLPTEQVDLLRPLLEKAQQDPENSDLLEKAIAETELLRGQLIGWRRELLKTKLRGRYEIQPRAAGRQPRRSGPRDKTPRPITVQR